MSEMFGSVEGCSEGVKGDTLGDGFRASGWGSWKVYCPTCYILNTVHFFEYFNCGMLKLLTKMLIVKLLCWNYNIFIPVLTL